MNRDEIKIKYPKSFDTLNEWMNNIVETDRIGIWWNVLFSEIRGFLYDFFDEQKIYIEINFIDYEPFFAWCISSKTESDLSRIMYGNRNQAEEQAFSKAFEILEEKLNESKGTDPVIPA